MRHEPAVIQGGASEALISDHPKTDTAVIFIHGFRGHHATTWNQFQELIGEREEAFPSWATSDVYFFSYDAENNHPDASAQEFSDFVDTVFPNPPGKIFGSGATPDWLLQKVGAQQQQRINSEWMLRRKGPYAYRRLRLIGHSLGAAIIRRYVANQFASWERACRLGTTITKSFPGINAEVFLFAAAHLGFQPSGHLALAFHSVDHFVGGLLRTTLSAYRAYNHLQPNSAFLKQLRSDTEQLGARMPERESLTPYLLWGKQEEVVQPGRFDCDLVERERYEAGRRHRDVCKPDRKYLLPLEFIERRMQRGAGQE